MARITKQSSIHTTGVSYENEPIIKSDGAGEVMQWQPSDGVANGVFVREEGGVLNLGVGVQTPGSIMSVSPIQYRAGTAAQSGTTVTGSGTTWTAAMIGGQFVYADGTTSGAITARASNTSVTVTTSQTVSSQAYGIHYTGLRVSAAGSVGVGVAPAVGLDVHHNNEISAGFGRADDGTNFISVRTAETQNNLAGIAFMTGATTQTGVSSSYQIGGVQSKVENDGGTLKGSLSFLTNSGDSIGTRMTISDAGTVSFAPIGNNKSIVIDTPTSTVNPIVEINDCNSLTDGNIMYLRSDSSNTNTRSLVKIHNDHESATGTTGLEVRNDSTGPAIKTTGGSGILIGSLDIGHGLGSGGTADINSTAVGRSALNDSTSGATCNTAIGASSLSAATSGDNNVAVGYNSLLAFTGSNATAVGSGAADSAVGQTNLTAIGKDAAGVLGTGPTSVGHNNTAVGKSSLQTIDGGQNTAVGVSALGADCIDNNTAVGKSALEAFTGSNATAVGKGAADAATTAADLVAIGVDALGNTKTGGYCTAVGYAAGRASISPHNTFIGNSAGHAVGDAQHVVAIGKEALGGATFNNATCDYNNDPTITHDADANIVVGLVVTGTGIPAGAKVDSITDSTHFELNQATTGGAVTNGTLTFHTNQGDQNIAIGSYTLGAATTGNSNIAIGHYALTANTTGYTNVAVGHLALKTNTTGFRSTAIGAHALEAQSPASTAVDMGNTAVGFYAGTSVTTGSANTIVGSLAGDALNTAGGNTVVGFAALSGDIKGDTTTAVGAYALTAQSFSSATNAYNTAIGYQTGMGLTTGTQNTIVGSLACSAGGAFDGSNNVVLGSNAALNATDMNHSIVIGTNANNIGVNAGANNVLLGHAAGQDIAGGASNILIGRDAGLNISAGNDNIAIGHGAMDAADTSAARHSCIAVGSNALGGQTAAVSDCVAIGLNALALQNANVKNTVIGGLAGDAIVAGYQNTLLGYMAGSDLVGHNDNVAIGHQALVNAAGNHNTAVGSLAGSSASNGTATQFTGSNNVLVGYAAGYDLTDGPGNVLMGYAAGASMTTGDYNIAIGFQAADAMDGTASHSSAGWSSEPSNHNIAVGWNALGLESSGANACIAIGKAALSTQNSTLTSGARYSGDSVNLAIGFAAGEAVSTGTKNVLIGHEAGSTISDHDENTAVGYNALKVCEGQNNTCLGRETLMTLNDGDYNTVLGSGAMKLADASSINRNVAVGGAALSQITNTSSSDNVALGYNAGSFFETTPAGAPTPDGNLIQATSSIYVGAGAASGLDPASTVPNNEIVIGYNAVGNGLNSFTLGNASTAALHCADTSIAALSDRRVKHDINDNAVGLDFINKLATVNYKKLNPADWPAEIGLGAYREQTYKDQLVTPAVEASEAVYEDYVVQEARAAVEEETREEVHAAIEEVTEDVVTPAAEAVYEDQVVVHAEAERTETNITQEAREEIKSERHKHSEEEVTETITGEEIVEVDGKWTKRATSEEVTRTVRTPLYEDCDLYDEDGSICTHCVTEAVEAKDAVVDEDGNEIEAAVEAVAEVRANDVHKVAVMEEYISQTAQEEVTETIVTPAVEEVTERVLVSEATEETTETRVVVEAKDAWTETHVTRPAEAAVEEVTERRLVSAAVEAKDAVYETVTVPADDRPADDDTIRLGLIAQDVQTAMTEAGVEFDIVNESPNGKLSLKYGNLVMPLIKAVQELSARVKTLEG